MQCGKVNSTDGEASKMDGFLKQKMMKVPDFADWSAAHEDECRQKCLQNCSCIAYAYDIGTGCMSWTRSLIDTLQFSSGGIDLYIRVAYSELGELFSFLSKFILSFKSHVLLVHLVKDNLFYKKRKEKKIYLVIYFV